MSIIEQAKLELAAINFGDEESATMLALLGLFFEQFDSGGAVSVAAPVLQRLIEGKPLAPLTGAPDEWVDHGGGVFQNRRCGSVFKDPRWHGGKLAYDLDAPDPRAAISFPYAPAGRRQWVDVAPYVDKFLAWNMPATVCSDACCTNPRYPHQRAGTSLLTADEARQMFEHVLNPPADPRDPDPARGGVFRDHNCHRCADGTRPCAAGRGQERMCGNLVARND